MTAVNILPLFQQKQLFFITGELYTISKEHEFAAAMMQIDEYEGLHTEPGEIPLFRREIVTVYKDDGSTVAWIYWYNRALGNSRQIASGDYLKQ